MRKVYVVIGTWTDDGHSYLAGVFSSWKKAEWYTKRFSEGRTYMIKTEILL